LREKGSDWYRESVLDFDVSNYILQSDSVAILWDGVRDNYLYSLQGHEVKKYFPKSPLNLFLTSPIKVFTINSGSQGCFHNTSDVVSYDRINDSTFATSKLSMNQYQGKEYSKFNKKISSTTLSNTLITINSNPSEIPTLNDFNITEQDKKNYLSLVDKRLKGKDYEYLNRKKKVNKDFYYAVLSMLDTLDNNIISAILNQQEGVWSTTSNWFTIQIINQNNDTLNITRNYNISSLPWNLPWQFEYNGLHFNSYNVEFSRFIDTCIPDNFRDKGFFDNSILIMEIADYLWNKK